MDLSLAVLFLAGLITGFSKFSVGGMGLLVLPIVMIAFPGPEALGVLLPLYIITDLMAIASYRSKIDWSVLARFLPLAFLGVFVGSYFLANVDADQFLT
ncbi:MAG: putative membrane protein YfcA, partial [Marinomonas primoryensis]